MSDDTDNSRGPYDGAKIDLSRKHPKPDHRENVRQLFYDPLLPDTSSPPRPRYAKDFDPDVLHPTWRDWLDSIALGFSAKDTATLHNVPYLDVLAVKKCPAGRAYIESKLLTGRFVVANLVQEEITRRLMAHGGQLSLDMLVKIYAIVMPKESSVSQMEMLRYQAMIIAREQNLSEAATEKMMEFLEAQAV